MEPPSVCLGNGFDQHEVMYESCRKEGRKEGSSLPDTQLDNTALMGIRLMKYFF